ncbi:MAG: dependent oxidoreductase, partial [Verrucomicrobiales bacterium]|nr:dependent oxidoreductase [Verrucomicrobiales bacterium]
EYTDALSCPLRSNRMTTYLFKHRPFAVTSMVLLITCLCVTGEEGVRGSQTIGKNYDVIVAGAGTGGIAAALQASRLGASVLLVESTDWIGGQMAAAGVTSMDEGYPPRSHVRERGVYGEFTMRARAYYRALGKSVDTMAVSEDHFAVEPDVAQRILQEMIRDTRREITPSEKPAVLDLLLCSEVTDVHRQGNRVTGVSLTISSGRKKERAEVGCKVLIDATEYGDVIPKAGAAYRLGSWRSDAARDTNTPPPVQPMTWTAPIQLYPKGVPPALVMNQPPPHYDEKEIRRYLGPGNPNAWTWKRFVQYRGMPDSTSPTDARNGTGSVATRTHINFSPNDQDCNALDVEVPELREQVEYLAQVRTLGVIYYFQHVMGVTNWSVMNDVGYDSSYHRAHVETLIGKHPDLKPFASLLQQFAVMPYVRESRRIQGVYTLKARDIRRKAPEQPAKFSTALAIADYPVDVHGAADVPGVVETDLDRTEDIPRKWIQFGYGPFQIPFETFIPQEVDGFLPAEKNLSQSRIVNGATRLQPSTMLTGQAAGAIAGISMRMQVQPRAVPPLAVQSALLDAGSTLSLSYFDDLPHGTELWKCVQLATLYQIISYPEPKFLPGEPVTGDEVSEAKKRLAEIKLPGIHLQSPISLPKNLSWKTREELARAVAAALLRALPGSSTP